MTALKLFVSHSSRLDDCDPPDPNPERLWDLLRATRQRIIDHYGGLVEVFVDTHSLLPGDDWNQCLDTALDRCKAAIILLSARAVRRSYWVQKEATLLCQRANAEPDFTLIPVTLAGETTPADLEQGYFRALRLGRWQCIRDAAGADDVLTGLRRALGEPDALAVRLRRTPVEAVRGRIADLLDAIPEPAVTAAVTACDGQTRPPAGREPRWHADRLARRFLERTQDEATHCFCIFEISLQHLDPTPELGLRLFALIRSLWVHPDAAARLYQTGIPQAADWRPLALAGRLVLRADPERAIRAYTLDRYLERALADPTHYVLIMATEPLSVERVREEIRRVMLPGPPLPDETPDELDQEVNKDQRAVVVVVPVPTGTQAPDRRLRLRLAELRNAYHRLVLLFAIQSAEESPGVSTDETRLPDLETLEPPLDAKTERAAYQAERRAAGRLDPIHPRRP